VGVRLDRQDWDPWGKWKSAGWKVFKKKEVAKEYLFKKARRGHHTQQELNQVGGDLTRKMRKIKKGTDVVSLQSQGI